MPLISMDFPVYWVFFFIFSNHSSIHALISKLLATVYVLQSAGSALKCPSTVFLMSS